MRFAGRVKGLGGPAAEVWDIHNLAAERRRRGEDVIVLTIGDPDQPTPAPIIDAAKASLDRGRTHYADVAGQPALRAAIAARHNAMTGATAACGAVSGRVGDRGAEARGFGIGGAGARGGEPREGKAYGAETRGPGAAAAGTCASGAGASGNGVPGVGVSGAGEAAFDAVGAGGAATRAAAVDPTQVVVLNGAQCALFAALQCLLDPGDEIVVFEPAYVTYPATVAATGATPVPVPLRPGNGFRLDPRDLEAALTPRTRAVLWNSPNNPTGAVATAAELDALAAVCRERDLWLVSDEVYAGLVFEGVHLSPSAFPGMAGRTVTVSSLSKSHAMTGWRLGWLVGPPDLAAHAANLALCMLYGSPAFVQDAATVALAGAGTPELAAARERYRRRRDAVVRRLSMLPGLRCHRPAGGMFVMVDVRGTGLSAHAFAQGLLAAEGVAVLPGDAFGAPAAGHVRLSLTVADDRLAEACERIGRYVFRLAALR